ncbi:DNA ligase D [Candidimonas sp. SYP-B2681]|uniref:DNA ligase D n=1 Tax=Candidimonas sp. SYP-B2681 TaxID=2497686 RepID=UPI000F862EAE|nr:DNA ligase D [Candidimonas sp. SYP-B2681]RTZ42426.1 DNA ligase D [Candidimonas sp. SYP-B2681]
MSKADPLSTYRSKRNFSLTSEPPEGGAANEQAPSFVIQKHWASRLHYDLRLEIDGSMKSWAVPKGPSFDPADKRMAVHVEDHPISYNTFEGVIPPKQYGAGKVIIWDKGTWKPLGDAAKAYREGRLKFELHGHKLHGKWALIRMKSRTEKQDPWLLIKEKDEFVRPASEFSVVDEMPDSVAGIQNKEVAESITKLPVNFSPELATLVDAPQTEADAWLYEIKFDGYRLLARIENNGVQLITRNGNDWTDKLTSLAKDLTKMKLPDGWYDGEIVVLDDRGIPDFQALQGAFDRNKTSNIVYYLFDLPFCDGHDLRKLPLTERREKLRTLVTDEGRKSSKQRKADIPGSIRFSDTFDVAARDIVASACRMGLEGVIGKKKASPYVSRRSADWIKLKCTLRQEFVIGGYTDPQGSREGIGSLLLGVHDAHGALHYAGNVGTGFNASSLNDIKQKLSALHSADRPFVESTGIDKKAHWVKPTLLAEVSFGQWTDTGRVRHSVFHGLRTDKPASAIIRETSMSTPATRKTHTVRKAEHTDGSPDNSIDRSAGNESLLSKMKITHPERVIDTSTATTKIQLIRYYALVAPLMLEHLKGRPVSLLRAPEGVNGTMFFQKHLETRKMTGVRLLSQELDPDHEPLMEVANAQGLLSAAQMNVIEFHTWNAIKTSIGKPDRMTFDLDPGEGVEWPAMQEAALVIRAFLAELELTSFVKTSGGKGLHVVVPLKRRHDWDTVKDFSQAVVVHVAKILPKRFAAKSGPRNRVGKIFIDYLRNGFGATTVAAWSARARPGMGVSVPVSWEEVEKLKNSAQWHVGNIHERLDRGNDPWRKYSVASQTLTRAMKMLKA